MLNIEHFSEGDSSRFSVADPEALKPEAEAKKVNKSGLQKKFEEKKAESGDAKKSDKEVLEAVITEISAAEKTMVGWALIVLF